VAVLAGLNHPDAVPEMPLIACLRNLSMKTNT
jgi:hypothetical protein